jgi:ribonuclease Z
MAARFAFLGTSGALASATRDNTSLVFVGDSAAVLADCGGAAMQRLRRLAIDPLQLTHAVVTHLHVDHAYGLPSLIRQLALLGRRAPLTVVCRPEHVEPFRTLLTVFGVWQRPDTFPLAFAPIDLAVGARAFTTGGLAVRTAPNEHGAMPCFAVRVDTAEGPAVVYSSDTRPSDAVVALARGADTLVHEATFAECDRARSRYAGTHSSATEAGQIAARAGVRRLLLTHIGAEYHDAVAALADEAGRHFGGVVEVAEELRPYSF